MNANHPLAQLLSGIVGDASKPSYHRCKNPGCVIRQIILRDGQINAKAVVGIPGTLTEDKVYTLTGVKGSENWATIDDEGVRFTGGLGMYKRQEPTQESPNAFYIGEELLEQYRQSLPEKEDEGHDDDEEPKVMSLSEAFREMHARSGNYLTDANMAEGDVVQPRKGFGMQQVRGADHGRVVVVELTAGPDADPETGEPLDAIVLYVDTRDGEIIYERVNMVRFELAPEEFQINDQGKQKAAALKKRQGE